MQQHVSCEGQEKRQREEEKKEEKKKCQVFSSKLRSKGRTRDT